MGIYILILPLRYVSCSLSVNTFTNPKAQNTFSNPMEHILKT